METPDFIREPPALPEWVKYEKTLPRPPWPAKVAILLLFGACAQVVLWLGTAWGELSSGGKVCCLFELSALLLLSLGVWRVRSAPTRGRQFLKGTALLVVQAGLLFAFEAAMIRGDTGGFNVRGPGSLGALSPVALAFSTRFLGPALAIPAASNGRRTLLLWLGEIWCALTLFAMFGLTR